MPLLTDEQRTAIAAAVTRHGCRDPLTPPDELTTETPLPKSHEWTVLPRTIQRRNDRTRKAAKQPPDTPAQQAALARIKETWT